jgi:replicative DNA helicase
MNRAESNLLSICLTYPDLLPNIRAIVQPEMFANKKYSTIYTTALNLYDKDVAVDSVTVSAEIMDSRSLLSKFGEEKFVNICLDEIRDIPAKAENFLDYSEIIVKIYRKSYTAAEAQKTAEKIKSGEDASSQVDILSEKVQQVERSSARPFSSFLEIAREEVGEISKRNDKGEVSMSELFVPTPFTGLNNFIYGFRYGSLSLLGARPAMGKTTFAVALAADAARRGIKTLFISIEMSKTEIAQKFISHASGIHFNKILEGYTFEEQDWTHMAEMLGQENEAWSNNLSIDDKSETTVDVMRSINWGINEGYKFIIVDHLHELAFDDRRSHISLTEAMGDFVKRLRNTAQRNNIALLALCQLNREVEKRSAKIPIASDLGESGTLERVAHNIIFLYRQEQHKGEVDVVVAKARGGQTGITTLDFDGGTNQVNDQKGNYGYE